MTRDQVLRVVVGLALVGSATAKFLSGWHERLVLPAPVFWFACVLEVGLAVALIWRRLAVPAAFGVVALAAGGVLVAYLGNGPCGCLGVWWQLTRIEHVWLASGLGLLALGAASTTRARLVVATRR
ncbi:MAG: hypothetical protein NXI31_11525 [bacterium]|nr:hypothetical protein [bacterium]